MVRGEYRQPGASKDSRNVFFVPVRMEERCLAPPGDGAYPRREIEIESPARWNRLCACSPRGSFAEELRLWISAVDNTGDGAADVSILQRGNELKDHRFRAQKVAAAAKVEHVHMGWFQNQFALMG
jgi:hypothetical protein